MLQIIKEYADGGAFQPEEVAILVAAFDDAWQRLSKSGAQFDSDRAVRATREQLGKRIIEMAKRGERDPRRLRDDALQHIAESWRGRSASR